MSKSEHKRCGLIRKVSPANPRSLEHPSHGDALGELAEALGRALADKLAKEMTNDETRSTVRPIFQRPAKRSVHRRSTARMPKRGET